MIESDIFVRVIAAISLLPLFSNLELDVDKSRHAYTTLTCVIYPQCSFIQ